jgi:hypothetical protein
MWLNGWTNKPNQTPNQNKPTGASKTEKMQMHFKFHICNKFIIVSDNFTYEAHYVIKIKWIMEILNWMAYSSAYYYNK